MSDFNENDINRDASGKFAAKVSGEPDSIDMSTTSPVELDVDTVRELTNLSDDGIDEFAANASQRTVRLVEYCANRPPQLPWHKDEASTQIRRALLNDQNRAFASELPSMVDDAKAYERNAPYYLRQPYIETIDADYDAVCDNPGEQLLDDVAWAKTMEQHRPYKAPLASFVREARWQAGKRIYGEADASKLPGGSGMTRETIPGVVENEMSSSYVLSDERNKRVDPNFRDPDGVYVGYQAQRLINSTFAAEMTDHNPYLSGNKNAFLDRIPKRADKVRELNESMRLNREDEIKRVEDNLDKGLYYWSDWEE